MFLYPIQPYANVLMGSVELPEVKKRYTLIYQNLVSRRYSDFQLVYIMFSEDGNPENPDMSQLWEGISIREQDIVGACGISFKEHCEKKIYPDPKKIISFCPRPIDKLIVAGFHFWDCVEKVAKYAHEQGIDVLVDDDLTEFFFFSIQGPKGLPLSSRIPSSLEKSRIKQRRKLSESGTVLLERVREARKGKPWLVKI